MATSAPAPASPDVSRLFFSTPAQRAALARERFFEEGESPAGLVNEAVLQSWWRCNAAGKRTQDRVAGEPVSPLRLQSAIRSGRQLLEASSAGLARLEVALAGTACQVLLTNANGLIISVGRRAPNTQDATLPALARTGIDLSEGTMGTTAPGIVSATGKGCSVLANEHFHQAILQVHCTAAPIHDVHGKLAGILDISTEGPGFGFDASALISSYACDIENRLLQLQSNDLLVLRFHAELNLLDTSLVALAGVDEGGRLQWVNGIGARLTGAGRGQLIEDVLGQTVPALLGLLRNQRPTLVRLPNGLSVWLQVALRAADGLATPVMALATNTPPAVPAGPSADAPAVPVATPAPAARALTLQDVQAERIADALASFGGNVAKTARALGVSRGLIYRFLSRADDTPDAN